jgi:ABC-2 type transport system ATP-binding protein
MITATHLNKSFGHVHAVRDLSLNVAPGEIYGLVGSDGAGKTTALRLLVGALKTDAGHVSIGGYDIQKQTEQARAQVGYLSQRFSLYEDLSVLENIRFFAEIRGLTAKEWLPRCLEILDFVGLGAFKDRRAGQLSGGMKQKLGLASALVTRPRVLLLDEPTTGVDPVTRQDFWQLIIKLVSQPIHREGTKAAKGLENEEKETLRSSRLRGEETSDVSVIISTPYMDEAARCHRIGFMRAGQIIAEGAPSELRAMLNGRVVELRGADLQQLRHIVAKDEDVEDVRPFGDRLHLRVKPARADSVIKRLRDMRPTAGVAVTEARLVPPGLEDVFIALSEQTHD